MSGLNQAARVRSSVERMSHAPGTAESILIGLRNRILDGDNSTAIHDINRALAALAAPYDRIAA